MDKKQQELQQQNNNNSLYITAEELKSKLEGNDPLMVLILAAAKDTRSNTCQDQHMLYVMRIPRRL